MRHSFRLDDNTPATTPTTWLTTITTNTASATAAAVANAPSTTPAPTTATTTTGAYAASSSRLDPSVVATSDCAFLSFFFSSHSIGIATRLALSVSVASSSPTPYRPQAMVLPPLSFPPPSVPLPSFSSLASPPTSKIALPEFMLASYRHFRLPTASESTLQPKLARCPNAQKVS
ncbi:hypothetical protein QOT17_025111 [Balamuthia mandrillaris]